MDMVPPPGSSVRMELSCRTLAGVTKNYLLWGKTLTHLVTSSARVFWVTVKETHRREELGFLYSGTIQSFPNTSSVKHLKMESETSGFQSGR